MNDLWQDLLHARPELTYALGLLLAVGVTLHVLLNKRDVASAVGWIALAWFAPILGSISYAILGVNRVRRRARDIRPRDHGRPDIPGRIPNDDRHLDPLKRGIDRITSRPVLAGNAVAIYDDGDQAYPPMLAAIAAARHSIGLSSYIFRNDSSGDRFIAALTEAQGRGVAVRVLIDGIGGNWLLSGAYHHLKREGVPAARFMHSLLPWRMPFFNLRSHKKILVIDGAVAFTGGLNIADENVMALHPKHPVQDTHFRLEGPVAGQLADAFARDWSFTTGEELTGDLWFPDIAPNGSTPARVIESGPDQDIEKVEFAALQAIACARDRIAVMTPYFLPDERLVTALALAAQRGVQVDITIPTRSNRVIVDWATRTNSRPALKDGVRIWRSPLPFRHSKAMVVDEDWCLVGSANWDMRSFRLNFELCVELHDRPLAESLIALMQQNRAAPLMLQELDSRPTPERLRDAAARLLLPYL